MPIKGLTDQQITRDARAGRTVRLGIIGKGTKTGHGRNVRLTDEDHLVFRPANGDERLAALFEAAYGPKPKEINDVRIAAPFAGDFDIEQKAWLTASKYTERGSTFLARSDGESILQARNEETGKVERYEPGEMPHDGNTVYDDNGTPCFQYDGKLYPWQQSLAIDLVLPEFNRLVFDSGVAGHGVVTLITHSTYDIANLIAEYYGILDVLIGLLSNPLKDDAERVRRWLPINDFPLRLYRAESPITTPDYRKNADPANRLQSTRSLLHLQLSPKMAGAIQEAKDQSTQKLLTYIAQGPQLPATVDQINADLFGDEYDGELAALPETVQKAKEDYPDFDELARMQDEPEIVEDDPDEVINGYYDETSEVVVGIVVDEDYAAAHEETLDSEVEDVWAGIEEKMVDTDMGKGVGLGVIADALKDINPAFENRGDVWNWLNGKENKDLRDKGLKIHYKTVVTPKGARMVYDRGVAYGG